MNILVLWQVVTIFQCIIARIMETDINNYENYIGAMEHLLHHQQSKLTNQSFAFTSHYREKTCFPLRNFVDTLVLFSLLLLSLFKLQLLLWLLHSRAHCVGSCQHCLASGAVHYRWEPYHVTQNDTPPHALFWVKTKESGHWRQIQKRGRIMLKSCCIVLCHHIIKTKTSRVSIFFTLQKMSKF